MGWSSSQTQSQSQNKEEDSMGWGAVVGAGLQLAGASQEGKAAENLAAINARNALYDTYAAGPNAGMMGLWDKAMDPRLGGYAGTVGARGAATYIRENVTSTPGYQRAIALGMDPTMYAQAQQQAAGGLGTITGAASGMQSLINAGGLQMTPEQVSQGAQSLLSPDLINAQVDAYGRDIGRNLGENVITGIRSSDIGSGNLGSSRGGVQEAIATRAAADRIANFRGGLVGNALTQSQNLLQSNISNQLGGYGSLANMGQAQMQGASGLTGFQGEQLSNLFNVGKLQQGLAEADIQNRIGARDWGWNLNTQKMQTLQGLAGMGNLVNPLTAKVN